MAGNNRRWDYDLLRVASMAAVVYLHTAPWALRQQEDRALWHFSNLVAALCTAAVPVFFLLSGALMLRDRRTEDPRHVLRRRLPKILVPGLFWSGVVIALLGYRDGWDAALHSLIRLPNTTVLMPYWFLYALVPMYLLAPLLKRMADGMEEKHWRYLLGLWGVLTLARQSAVYLVPAAWQPFFVENPTLTVSAVGGFLGYFMLGAYLERLEKLPPRRLLWAVLVIDWAVMSLGTWWDFRAGLGYSERFLSYRGLFMAVQATAIVLLARSYGHGRTSGRALRFLSGASFGVYLVHPFAIQAAEKVISMGGIGGQLSTWLLALSLSLLATILAASIKPLCFLMTGQKFETACQESNLFAMFRSQTH